MADNVIEAMKKNAKNNLAAEREAKEVFIVDLIPELSEVDLDNMVGLAETLKRRMG